MIYHQSNQSRMMRITTKSLKVFPPLPAFFPGLILFPISLLSSPSAVTGGWGKGDYGSLNVFSALQFFSFLRCFPPLADWSSHQHAYPAYINRSYGCTVLHVSLMQMFGLFLNKTWRVNSCNRKQLVMKDTPLTFIIYYDNDRLSKICQACGNICTSASLCFKHILKF